MASVFKRSRWVDANGKQTSKNAPGARKVKAKVWTIALAMPDGRIRRMRGYSDKAATMQRAAELERKKAQGAEGLVDIYAPHRRRPLSEHLQDYFADLAAKGRAESYIGIVRYRLNKLVAAARWKVLADITPGSFLKWRASIPKMDDGRPVIGPVSMNQCLTDMRAFCSWCVKPAKRLPANPLVDVEKVDESGDIRRARRAFSEDEIARLLAVVSEAHRTVYRFLLTVGLRRNEAATLVWGDLHLSAVRPFVSLRAALTKNRQADILPLRADIAAELASRRGDAGDGERVFRDVPSMRVHKRYLKEAGIPWLDSDGRRADVHALRHSYGTMLGKTASPREAQALMRHSTLALTGRYTDTRLFDLAGVVERLPLPPANGYEAGKATGTDGSNVDSAWRESGISQSSGIVFPSAGIGEHSSPENESRTLVVDRLNASSADIGGDDECGGGYAVRLQATFEDSPANPQIPPKGGTKVALPFPADRPVEPDLRRLVVLWPTLPEPTKQAIMVMVASTEQSE